MDIMEIGSQIGGFIANPAAGIAAIAGSSILAFLYRNTLAKLLFKIYLKVMLKVKPFKQIEKVADMFIMLLDGIDDAIIDKCKDQEIKKDSQGRLVLLAKRLIVKLQEFIARVED